MTTLTAPSLDQRLLQAIKEEVEATAVREWPRESVELCSVLLRQIRETTASMFRTLEKVLAGGIEARAFARDGGSLRTAAEDRAATIRAFIETLSSSEDAASATLLAELHELAKEEQAYRNLLAEALTRVMSPPPLMDWDRLKREADADFAAGRFVRFETEEEMFEGLAGHD